MVIKNASVLTENFVLEDVDVRIGGEIITEIGNNLTDEELVDGVGKYLIPGFIDIHSHGAMGHDGCDANPVGYEKMADFYASKGVTSFLFTTMTLDQLELCKIVSEIATFMDSFKGKSYAHGIYLEGPFINPVKKGAQAGEHIIAPNYAMLSKFMDACNDRIKVVVVAPEMENGLEFIEKASKKCAVSIAHTASNYETTVAAINSGATNVTHLFNAMPPFLHRDPGVVGAAIDNENVFMEMICDGLHLHPCIIRTMMKVAKERIIFISDSMCAAGMKNGEYSLGGQAVTVKDGKAVLVDGTLAGSVSNVHSCVKNAVSFGVKFEDAVRAGSYNPAKMIGVDDITGRIKTGLYADVVLLNKQDLSIDKVFVKGVQKV